MRSETKTRKSKLLETLKHKKVLSSKELEKYVAGRTILRRMVEAGEIQSIGSGYYATNALDPFVAATLVVTKYYPKAVISNYTALVIHKLSDEIIEKIDVDIERNKSIRNNLLSVHRVPAKRSMGITKLPYHNETIRIYDKERTIAEAYLIDSGATFYKALKRYLKSQEPDIDKIQKYDRRLKTKVLERLRQELADA